MPPKPPLTHFLCIPLITSNSRAHLQSSLSAFTTATTTPSDTNPVALLPKAIRPIGSLHFTLGVMSLPTPERIEAACSFLRGLDIVELLRHAEAGIIANDEAHGDDTKEPPPKGNDIPLQITLAGLHAMQPPSKTSSLYTHPTPTSSPALTPFCRALLSAFRDSGFLLPETRNFKLHATIVNTIYAREAKSGKKRWSKDSGKIDATELIERYKDFEWVKHMRIDRVAICEMGAKKIMEGEEVVDEIYTEIASVLLP